MHRMTKPETGNLGPWAKPDADSPSRNELEGFQKRSQADPRWSVLIANDYRCFTFGAAKLLQLETVSDKADVSLVGVEEVDGPILCLVPVVSKRTREFELEPPPAGDQKVRRSLGSSCCAVRGQRVEVFGHGAQELRLTIRANTRLKLLEGDSTGIDGDQRFSNVLND